MHGACSGKQEATSTATLRIALAQWYTFVVLWWFSACRCATVGVYKWSWPGKEEENTCEVTDLPRQQSPTVHAEND